MTKFENWIDSGLPLKVIVQSNNECYKVGTLLRFAKLNEKSSEMPFVEIDGITYAVFSVIIPYSEEVEAMLKPLDFKRQWEILSTIYTAAQIARGR
jgi:hypothetical protein